MATVFCANCGVELQSGYVFCPECGTKVIRVAQEATPAVGPQPKAMPAASSSSTPLAFQLVRVPRGGGDAVIYPVPPEGLTIGRGAGDLRFEDDDTLCPKHAFVKPEAEGLWVKDLSTTGGVLAQIRGRHLLVDGDVFVAGEQVLRFTSLADRLTEQEFRPYAAQGELMAVATLTRILRNDQDGDVYAIRALPFVLGREEGDVLFAQDRFLSRRHCAIESAAKGLALVDLKSRNGTFIRKGGSLLVGKDEVIMVGQQILRIDVSVR